jgi:hypothetical protein
LPGEQRQPLEGKTHEAKARLEGGSGFGGNPKVLPLSSEVDQVVGVVGWTERRTQYLREYVAGGIGMLFALANAVTLLIVIFLMAVDQRNIVTHLIAPADRVITSQVIMTLLGATAVQVGVIAVIIARYLFPGRAE